MPNAPILPNDTPCPEATLHKDTSTSCRFYMLRADFVRGYQGTSLPFFQELRSKHPEAIEEKTITYSMVVLGKAVDKCLAVSHRWLEPDNPDPDGEQLRAIKKFLDSSDGAHIELVWIDAHSMPQDQPKGTRTEADTDDFKRMLSQVNMLFLGMTVLILLDLSCMRATAR